MQILFLCYNNIKGCDKVKEKKIYLKPQRVFIILAFLGVFMIATLQTILIIAGLVLVVLCILLLKIGDNPVVIMLRDQTFTVPSYGNESFSYDEVEEWESVSGKSGPDVFVIRLQNKQEISIVTFNANKIATVFWNKIQDKEKKNKILKHLKDGPKHRWKTWYQTFFK